MVRERHVLRRAALFSGCRHTGHTGSGFRVDLGGAAVKRSWPGMMPITGPWHGRSVAKHPPPPRGRSSVTDGARMLIDGRYDLGRAGDPM